MPSNIFEHFRSITTVIIETFIHKKTSGMETLMTLITLWFFLGMADFQCLAVHSDNGKEMSLYDKIILRKSENQEFFHQPMPHFLPPPIFSRLDSPVDYYYRPDIYQKSQTAGWEINSVYSENPLCFILQCHFWRFYVLNFTLTVMQLYQNILILFIFLFIARLPWARRTSLVWIVLAGPIMPFLSASTTPLCPPSALKQPR